MKDLWTHTKADHDCDETDARGKLFFTPLKKEDKFDDTL
jgi:hypothetical protein